MSAPPRDLRGLYALLERYIDGDRRAFAQLHARLEGRLRGFLIKLVRDEAACDDLLQVTLLKAHLARDRFRLIGGSPDGAVLAWYFAIARNVAMDYLREQYRSAKRSPTSGPADDAIADDLPDEAPSIEAAKIEDEREGEIIDEVRAAIALLPPGQREVVELHKLRGLSMAEVARRLQVREGAIRVRAHRAYKALARLLEPKTLGAFWFGVAHWPWEGLS